MMKWFRSQNKQNKTRKRRLALIFITAVTLAGVLAVLWASLPPVEEPSEGDIIGHFEYQFGGAKIAHAQPGVKGCDVCHAEAIYYDGTCTYSGCHAPLTPPYQITPTTMLINFPHHDASAPPGGYDCGTCHAGVPNDARYVTVPVAGHDGTLCADCHSRTHTPGP